MEDFELLYKLHHKKLFSYIYARTGDYYITEEILQETFCQALKSAKNYRGECKVSTWLYQIEKYTINNYNHIEKRGRKIVEKINCSDTEQVNPEKITIDRIFNKDLITSINQLAEPYRDVLILRGLNELSYREIAEVIGKTENWAKVTFYRGKIKLGEVLSERGVLSGD